ncbi:hypothetical protein [Metabacillus fastidiosus]|uniref:hypothetical protein n=1 Tax=Metabacillus fastidiosus TaxID=1458 RepID=UPI003D2DE33E
MRKKLVRFCLILIALLILQGCEIDNMFNFGSKTTYVHHFPEEQSPALTEFMNNYILMSLVEKLFKENKTLIFADAIRNHTDKTMLYYEHTEEQMEQYYKPILNAKEPYDILRNLRSTDKVEKELLTRIKDPFNYSLPVLAMEENNQLRIKTTLNEKVLDLPKLMKEYGVKKTDEIEFDLLECKDNYFILEISDYSVETFKEEKLFLTLFIKKDLSEIVISEWFDESIQEKLNEGELDSFLRDFQQIGESDRYVFLYGRTIIDTETKKIVKINEEDYLSNDGQYIYINGAKDKLEDGIQKIQTIENYAARNEVYEIEYKLNYKEIAKELDFATSGFGIKSGIGLADINYFNENYIVLSLTYKGRVVGTAGSINVLIDFQKNKQKPTFYLVDLGIASISQIR